MVWFPLSASGRGLGGGVFDAARHEDLAPPPPSETERGRKNNAAGEEAPRQPRSFHPVADAAGSPKDQPSLPGIFSPRLTLSWPRRYSRAISSCRSLKSFLVSFGGMSRR